MFAAYCETTHTTNLMSARRIVAFHNGDHGVSFEYRCLCGSTARYQAGAGDGRHIDASIHKVA